MRQKLVKPSKSKPRPSSRIGRPQQQTQCKQQKQQVQQVQNQQHSQQMNNSNNQSQVFDLTQTYKPRKFIKQSTLLVGSSILKNVKTYQLHENNAVRIFPGATIGTIKSKISDFNIEQCETLISMLAEMTPTMV